MYRKLQPRRNGPPRAAVQRDQRQRILGALTIAVVADGYEGTSVEQVCRLAGVSKRAFYEQFKNKADCHRWAIDAGVAALERRIASAAEEARDDAAAVSASFTAIADMCIERPETMGLLLRTPFAVASHGHARTCPARRTLESVVESIVEPSAANRAVAIGIASGLEGALRQRLMGGDGRGVRREVESLAGWIRSYSPDVLEPVRLNAKGLFASLAGSRPESERQADPRWRVMRAAAEAAAVSSPDALPDVDELAQRAGAAPGSLGASFHSPVDCLRAAAQLACAGTVLAIASATRECRDESGRAQAGVLGLMTYIRTNPLARPVALAAGHPGVEGRRLERELIYALTASLSPARPRERSTRASGEATVSGLAALVQVAARPGTTDHAFTEAAIGAATLVGAPILSSMHDSRSSNGAECL